METTRIRRRGFTPFRTGLSIHCTPFFVDELAVPSGQYERQQGRFPPRHRQHCGIYQGTRAGNCCPVSVAQDGTPTRVPK